VPAGRSRGEAVEDDGVAGLEGSAHEIDEDESWLSYGDAVLGPHCAVEGAGHERQRGHLSRRPLPVELSARCNSGEEHEDCGDGGGDVEEREQGAVLRFLAHGRDNDLNFLQELTSPMTCCQVS